MTAAADGDLRVALDMSLAVVGMTGVQRYATVLHEQLRAWPGIEVRSFAAGRGDGAADVPIGRRTRVPLRVVHALWRTVRWPRAETMAGGADVVHALGGLPPPTRRPLVVTVHDLLPLTHPQFFIERTRDEAAGLARALDRAAMVVTTCEATKVEIERVAGFPLDRIVVAPLGPRSTGAPAAASVSEPFLLAVGAVTPRKGLSVLADAIAQLGPDCPPVLVAGPDGFFSGEVREDVAHRDVHERFRFLGLVDDDRLDELLATATVVCHPSLAEGFGMVCLEAMAHGAPVVAADLPSVREIAGDTAVLVPPNDANAFAGALEGLLADRDGARQLGDHARARAAGYTWKGFTGAIVGAYERAAESN